MLTWLQPVAGPANCHCLSRDKPHGTIPILPSPWVAWGQGRPPLLPKPPKIHLQASSCTSVRDWTPHCSRSMRSLPKLNFLPDSDNTQHGLWYSCYPGMCLNTQNQQELIAKYQCPFKLCYISFSPGESTSTAQIYKMPHNQKKKKNQISFQGGHSPAKPPLTSWIQRHRVSAGDVSGKGQEHNILKSRLSEVEISTVCSTLQKTHFFQEDPQVSCLRCYTWAEPPAAVCHEKMRGSESNSMRK